MNKAWHGGILLNQNCKVLLLGGSGFVGSRLIASWSQDCLKATFCNQPLVGAVQIDLKHDRLADRFFTRGHNFTHVILAHGMTKLKQCASLSAEAVAINVTGTVKAIEDAVDAGVQPIFLSSDAVFDGRRGPRSEDEVPSPILSYGLQKLKVETYLSRLSSPWTILRLTKVVASFMSERNLLSQWLLQLDSLDPIQCATDQVLSPIDVDDIVRSLQFVIENSVTGVFHVAGSDVVTRYELLQTLLRHVPEQIRREARIHACLISDIPAIEPLPINCSLSNTKFRSASGISPRSMNEICAELCQKFSPAGLKTYSVLEADGAARAAAPDLL
jgi:dTDP-4-dehydrorhamnose reductase